MASSESVLLPVGEITVFEACCCSICGCSCLYPQCVGCAQDGVCCCFKSNVKCCKPVSSEANKEGKCCICSEGGVFCVKPNTCCSSITQCCCIDSRSAFPCTDKVPCIFTFLPFCVCCAGGKCKMGCGSKVKDLVEVAASEIAIDASEQAKKQKSKELSDIPIHELLVCCGSCCAINSCYCSYPGCCGCKLTSVCCCCQQEAAYCKVIQEENNDGICCICQEGGCYCVSPKTCCGGQQQCFCLDQRCAFPCHDEVPCIFTCLPCCTVCADYQCKMGCCANVGYLVPRILPEVEGKQQMLS